MSLLIFCLVDLTIDISGVLNSPTVIILLSIFPFRFINTCFMYFCAPMLGASIFINMFSCWIDSCHYVMPFFVFHYSLCFKVYSIWYEYIYTSLFIFICMESLHTFTFNLCVSLLLKWVSYRQHRDGSCFLIHSTTLCLLIGEFSSFTFKVIIDRYVLIAILSVVF